jgi:hypothetical protein
MRTAGGALVSPLDLEGLRALRVAPAPAEDVEPPEPVTAAL